MQNARSVKNSRTCNLKLPLFHRVFHRSCGNLSYFVTGQVNLLSALSSALGVIIAMTTLRSLVRHAARNITTGCELYTRMARAANIFLKGKGSWAREGIKQLLRDWSMAARVILLNFVSWLSENKPEQFKKSSAQGDARGQLYCYPTFVTRVCVSQREGVVDYAST